MSRALLVRSIPLSSSTRDAWKEAGAMFARRERTPQQVVDISNGRPVINLGHSGMDIEGFWNKASVVRPLLNPKDSRVTFNSLMPTSLWVGEGYYWLKGQGRGGANKEKVYIEEYYAYSDLLARANWIDGDVQLDIVGQEYRVITVGHKVVQVSERHGANGQRNYVWVGVSNAPAHVKETARAAARKLSSEQTIIGWDIMSDNLGGSFILEGNSCPGVNAATADRILNAVESIPYNGEYPNALYA